MEIITTRKRWRWIGHVLCKDANSITKVVIHWTPEEKRKRCRPKTTWRRTVEVEMKKNHSWGTIQRLASDRLGWRSFVAALYVMGSDDDDENDYQQGLITTVTTTTKFRNRDHPLCYNAVRLQECDCKGGNFCIYHAYTTETAATSLVQFHSPTRGAVVQRTWS